MYRYIYREVDCPRQLGPGDVLVLLNSLDTDVMLL